MGGEEFLKRNNYLMSHGHLPYDTTTCETWGLSGNCGKNCPNFKNKTCDVYVDVLERINQELQQQNQKYKEVIDKAIMYVNSTRYSDINGLQKYSIKEFWFIKELEDILKEVE